MKVLATIITVLTCCVIFPNQIMAMQKAYPMPQSLEVKFYKKAENSIIAKFTPLIGVLRDFDILIKSSPDIEINRKKVSHKELSKAKALKLNFQKNNQKFAGTTWVKLLVKYNPDHKELLKKVRNKKEFPDFKERTRLVHRIFSIIKRSQRFTEAFIYRFEETEEINYEK